MMTTVYVGLIMATCVGDTFQLRDVVDNSKSHHFSNSKFYSSSSKSRRA